MTLVGALWLVGCLVLAATAVSADTVQLVPTKDNSMYQNFGGCEANGGGAFIFAGNSGCCGPRRALIAFDIAGAIPAGASIDSATLDLTVNMNPPGATDTTISAHPLSTDWGEGTTDAGTPGGFGVPAGAGEACWDFAFFNTGAWATPGGDFGAASGSGTAGNTGSVTSITGLGGDVQGWLDNPAGNFGWALLGDEAGNNTARRFASREAATSGPVLTVEFSMPAVCGNGVREGDEQCDDGNTTAGDGCSPTCTIEPGTAIPTVGEWGLILLSVMLLGMGVLVFRRSV
ncbi:MAG: IPTL-CTERM sorting domain-containing protein [bacterium]|nr:IPTL-CTERM sorting domain-containing protein [bacterium]